MMAELVAESAQEGSKRRDFLPHFSPHPEPDQHGLRGVIPEKLKGPTLADSQRSGRKNSDSAEGNVIKSGRRIQKRCAGTTDIPASPGLHSYLDGLCDRRQAPIMRQFKRLHSISLQKACPVCLAFSGFPPPRLSRLLTANGPNSSSRVFSGC